MEQNYENELARLLTYLTHKKEEIEMKFPEYEKMLEGDYIKLREEVKLQCNAVELIYNKVKGVSRDKYTIQILTKTDILRAMDLLVANINKSINRVNEILYTDISEREGFAKLSPNFYMTVKEEREQEKNAVQYYKHKIENTAIIN